MTNKQPQQPNKQVSWFSCCSTNSPKRFIESLPKGSPNTLTSSAYRWIPNCTLKCFLQLRFKALKVPWLHLKTFPQSTPKWFFNCTPKCFLKALPNDSSITPRNPTRNSPFSWLWILLFVFRDVTRWGCKVSTFKGRHCNVLVCLNLTVFGTLS